MAELNKPIEAGHWVRLRNGWVVGPLESNWPRGKPRSPQIVCTELADLCGCCISWDAEGKALCRSAPSRGYYDIVHNYGPREVEHDDGTVTRPMMVVARHKPEVLDRLEGIEPHLLDFLDVTTASLKLTPLEPTPDPNVELLAKAAFRGEIEIPTRAKWLAFSKQGGAYWWFGTSRPGSVDCWGDDDPYSIWDTLRDGRYAGRLYIDGPRHTDLAAVRERIEELKAAGTHFDCGDKATSMAEHAAGTSFTTEEAIARVTGKGATP